MAMDPNALRMAFVYRADLDMPRAKGEIQLGHGVGFIVEELLGSDGDTPSFSDNLDLLRTWLRSGQPKVNMEVDDMAGLERIMETARRRGVPHRLVIDEAHTVFTERTATCVAIGPMTKTDCNAVTRTARRRE
jgi:peptidyl-tRNA hydrolase